jgi:quinolinate synthase
MAMNGLKEIEDALLNPLGREVFVDMKLRDGALKSLDRMLTFNNALASK